MKVIVAADDRSTPPSAVPPLSCTWKVKLALVPVVGAV